MAEDVYVVAYDGIERAAVDLAAAHAKKCGARLHIVHVLEWSPYSFLTASELAERHKHREEELARAIEKVLGPILEHARRSGTGADGEVRHGNPVDTVCAIARERGAAMIFAGRSNKLSERVFGSVASGLAQCATVPVVIVP
jgi:nucleotide-binding universal stress UspA family protein